MYFYYGIKNSTLEDHTEGDHNNIELTVTDHEKPTKHQYTVPEQNIYR